MAISGYNRRAILEQIAVELEAIVPTFLDQVNVRMPTRDILDVRKVTQRTKRTIYVVDTPGVQPEGRVSSFVGPACTGGYITDFGVGLVGVAPLAKEQDPQDVIDPLFEAVFDVLLHNTTRNDGSGPLCMDTIPISTNHTAREQAPRIAWNMLFVCPFEWKPE